MPQKLNRQDRQFLDEAIEISKNNVANGAGGPFGAVIVKSGNIISRAANTVTGSNDPTAHAEMDAIRGAAKQLNHYHLNECTLYSSCEPCPMCLAAAYWARIERIVFANTMEQAAKIGFDDRFFYDELAKRPGNQIIEMIHAAEPKALDVFEQWHNSENKITY